MAKEIKWKRHHTSWYTYGPVKVSSAWIGKEEKVRRWFVFHLPDSDYEGSFRTSDEAKQFAEERMQKTNGNKNEKV